MSMKTHRNVQTELSTQTLLNWLAVAVLATLKNCGESGSAGGPGAARGKRIDITGGGYTAPRVPATSDAIATAANVARGRRYDRSFMYHSLGV